MIKKDEIKIKTELTGKNRLYFECLNIDEDFEYAFYIIRDGVIIDRIPYSKKRYSVYWLTLPGEYIIQFFIRDKNNPANTVIAKNSGVINYKGLEITKNRESEKKQWKLIKNVIYVSRENWHHRKRMFRLAVYDFKLINQDSRLGILWGLLNPLIQIMTYWLVFGLGIRKGSPVSGHSYLIWMLCGLIPWFFISEAILQGANSVYTKSSTVLRLKYPVSTLPTGSIVTRLFTHLVLVILLTVTVIIYGYKPTFAWLNILYYIIAEFIFLTAFSMVTSVLTMIARDFYKLLNSLIRLLFFLTPILWYTDNLSSTINKVLKLNPLFYPVNGFRDGFLYGISFYEHPYVTIYFWAVTLILYIFGCNLQMKYKNKFADLI